jgi:transposase InsO family protein
VAWYNNTRLLGPIGHVPPAEFEESHHRDQQSLAKVAGLNQSSLRDSRGSSILYSLSKARVMSERWRHEYNTIRPHSALGYRPPAPEAIQPLPPGSASLRPAAGVSA